MMKIRINHATAAEKKGRLPPAPAKSEAKRLGLVSCCLRPKASPSLKPGRSQTQSKSVQPSIGVATACRHNIPSSQAPHPQQRLPPPHSSRLRPSATVQVSQTQSNHALGVATASRHNTQRCPSGPDLPPTALDRACGKAQPQHSALPGTRTSTKTPPSYPSKWPKTVNHAVLGSTPAPGVVFRALAENRARRGISSVCVKFARTTAKCRTHSAIPFVIRRPYSQPQSNPVKPIRGRRSAQTIRKCPYFTGIEGILQDFTCYF